MRKRSFLVAVLAVGLLASPAFATTALHGRGPDTQARMLAMTVTVRGRHVQILDRSCEDPSRQRRCEPITRRLQTAIEAAIDARIAWVGHRQRHAGQFWVFAPVRFRSDGARTKYAWRDAGRHACVGWTRLDWHLQRGAWDPFRGVGVAGCPAVAVA